MSFAEPTPTPKATRWLFAALSVLGLSSIGVLSACAQSSTGLGQPSPSATAAQSTTTITTTSTTTTTITTTVGAPQVDPDTLRTQVASLMFVGVRNFEEAHRALELGAGGLFIPSWADPGLLTTPGRNIQALREEFPELAFEVAIDFEGGRVQRHQEVLGSWPSPRELAANHSPDDVRAIAHSIGASLHAHGITIDFAPVLDLDGGGLEVVGDRAFSTDPHTAASYATAFAEGLSDAGVHAVFKHFPGHGRATGDTHLGLASTPPLEEMKKLDLIPYGESLSNSRGAGVMVGHMIVPGLGDPSTPGSLNPATYRLLREGTYPGGRPFNGPVITDDLSGMKAISDLMGTTEAVRRALIAGADQALWSSGDHLEECIDAVLETVATGELSARDIAEKSRRAHPHLPHASS